MNVSCSNGFAPWGIARGQRWLAVVVFLVIEKTGSRRFLLSSAPLTRPYIVKMTWSCPKMPFLSTEDFIFIWSLANAVTKFHISVIQWARKHDIMQKLYFMTLVQKNLNTYNCRFLKLTWKFQIQHTKFWL